MADILVVPWAGSEITTGCSVSASIDGGATVAAVVRDDGVAVLTVPDDCASVTITATPGAGTWWPVSATLVRDANGALAGSGITPGEVLLGATQDAATGVGVPTVYMFMSQLRDVTATALAGLQSVPAVRANDLPDPPAAWLSTVWGGLTVPYLPFVGAGHAGGRQLNVGPLDVMPDAEWCVFQVAGVTAPQTIAVSWPWAVPRSDNAAPSPFLVYLHPNVGQNAPAFYTHPDAGEYPFGFDYVYFGLWRYLVYRGDPLTWDPYCKGLPTQIATSGKPAVLVLPGNKVGPEIGSMLDAGFTDALLRDLQGVMFRRAGSYAAPPGLGRTALASFSAGNLLLSQFLSAPANRQHPFWLDTLREVYFFEAPGDVADLVAAARQWQRSGTAGDKRIEVFSQDVKAPYRDLAPPVPGLPSVSTSADGLSTVTYAPVAAWQAALAAVSGVPGRTLGWQDAHQLISALGLADALSRSRF